MSPKEVRKLFKLAELRRRIDSIGTWSSMVCARARTCNNQYMERGRHLRMRIM